MGQAAESELKRADHLIHISLKYTRTTDVLLSILKRFVSAIESEMKDSLDAAKEKGHIKEVEKSPKMITAQLKKVYKNSAEINELIDFYYLLRRILNADYIRKEEFRKNVTLFAFDDQGTEFARIMTDTVKEYYKKVEDLIKYMEENIQLLRKRKK